MLMRHVASCTFNNASRDWFSEKYIYKKFCCVQNLFLWKRLLFLKLKAIEQKKNSNNKFSEELK